MAKKKPRRSDPNPLGPPRKRKPAGTQKDPDDEGCSLLVLWFIGGAVLVVVEVIRYV